MTRYRPGDTVAVKGVVTGTVIAGTGRSVVEVTLDIGDSPNAWIHIADLEPFTERDPTDDPICEEAHPDD